jgi:hypothetical protein
MKLLKRPAIVLIVTFALLAAPPLAVAQCVSCSTIYAQAVSAANERLSQCIGYYNSNVSLIGGCYAEYTMRMAGASAAYAACKLIPDCPA